MNLSNACSGSQESPWTLSLTEIMFVEETIIILYQEITVSCDLPWFIFKRCHNYIHFAPYVCNILISPEESYCSNNMRWDISWLVTPSALCSLLKHWGGKTSDPREESGMTKTVFYVEKHKLLGNKQIK